MLGIRVMGGRSDCIVQTPFQAGGPKQEKMAEKWILGKMTKNAKMTIFNPF